MNYDIFTTCSQCGKLLYISHQSFELIQQSVKNQNLSRSDSSGSPSRRNSSFIISNPDIEYKLNIKNQSYIEEFRKIQNLLSFQNTDILFPFCQDCTAIYLNHITYYKLLIDQATKTITKKFYNIPKEVFTIQYGNAIRPIEFKSNESTLSTTHESSPLDLPPKQSSKTMNNDRYCQDPFNCTNSVHQHYPLLFEKPDKSQKYCPFITCFAFHISYQGHYATINDNRIGFYKYDPNTISENNIALFFILQLIDQLKNAFKIDRINIRYTPNPSISIGNDALYELIIPDKKKKIHPNDALNAAINSLYEAFTIISNSSNLQGSLIPPYDIDLSNKTVGSVSYIFTWKSVENWSLAMRYLLFNLKNLQFRSVRSCFYH